jgi:hypothetical protein
VRDVPGFRCRYAPIVSLVPTQTVEGAKPVRGHWLRFPFVLATIGGTVLLGVGGFGSFHSIRFATGGVITQARVKSERTEIIGVWTGLTAGRFHTIRSRRVDYEFEDLDGKTYFGSDGWNGGKLWPGDVFEVQFMRADPESNRVHPDYGSDWLGNLLFLVVGSVVLAIPRFSKPMSGMVLAFLGVIAAFFITAWAAICVVATFATRYYRPIVAQAMGWALLSLLVLLAARSRLERGSRVFAMVIAVADCAVLFVAIARLLGMS